MLNIPSTVVDPNYRYRMPKMVLKGESKGNGVKTNIVNLEDVAKYLRTHQSYILKWFGFEKASQTTEKVSQNKSNKVGKSNTNYIIQGSFTDEQLLKVLDKFIQKYILCPKCKLPEMHMYIVNEKIHGKCDSCPFNGQLDNKHKLASFIVKNPPTYKPQAVKAAKVIEKQEKTQQKEEENKQQKDLAQNGGTKKIEQVPQTQIQEEATKLFSSQNLEFGSPQLEQLVQYTRKYISKRKNEDFDIASAQTVQNLKRLQLKKTLLAYVVFNALFTVNIAKQAKENAQMYNKLMKRLVANSDENIQIETLLNLQYLFLQLNKDKDFSKYIPTILNILIQSEILSKQFIMKWAKGEFKDIDKFFMFNDTRNQKFLQMATDLISHLQQDSNDSDDN